MDSNSAIAALGALAQATRLDKFRLLAKHELDRLPAGEVARLLDVPQNTMSAHLATLARAELVLSEWQRRSVVFSLGMYLVADGLRNAGLTDHLAGALIWLAGQGPWIATIGTGFGAALLPP